MMIRWRWSHIIYQNYGTHILHIHCHNIRYIAVGVDCFSLFRSRYRKWFEKRVSSVGQFHYWVGCDTDHLRLRTQCMLAPTHFRNEQLRRKKTNMDQRRLYSCTEWVGRCGPVTQADRMISDTSRISIQITDPCIWISFAKVTYLWCRDVSTHGIGSAV